jgi:hypothetical protein
MIPLVMSMVLIRHPRGLVAFSTISTFLIFGTLFSIFVLVTPHLGGDLYPDQPLRMYGSVDKYVRPSSKIRIPFDPLQ